MISKSLNFCSSKKVNKSPYVSNLNKLNNNAQAGTLSPLKGDKFISNVSFMAKPPGKEVLRLSEIAGDLLESGKIREGLSAISKTIQARFAEATGEGDKGFFDAMLVRTYVSVASNSDMALPGDYENFVEMLEFPIIVYSKQILANDSKDAFRMLGQTYVTRAICRFEADPNISGAELNKAEEEFYLGRDLLRKNGFYGYTLDEDCVGDFDLKPKMIEDLNLCFHAMRASRMTVKAIKGFGKLFRGGFGDG